MAKSVLKAVMIDDRETERIKKLHFDCPVLVQRLAVGDAWLSTDTRTIVVERKTFSDLLASIADDRLFTQAAKLAECEWPYLAVMGIPRTYGGNVLQGGRPTGWRWISVMGALLTVQEMGIPIVFRESNDLYKDTLLWLAGRKHDPVRVQRKRAAELQSPAEQLLCTFPNVGEKQAGALIEKYKTAAWAIVNLAALEETAGLHIRGVGKATRREARRLLGLNEDEQLILNRIEGS